MKNVIILMNFLIFWDLVFFGPSDSTQGEDVTEPTKHGLRSEIFSCLVILIGVVPFSRDIEPNQ